MIRECFRGGHNGVPGWWVRFDYDEDLIERLKDAIPSKHRAWDQANERWWVSLDFEEELIRVLPGVEAYRAQGSLL